jgi:hypothetical protein
VIATDADVDGMHIRLLLLTFFLQFFPELIRERPPLHPADAALPRAQQEGDDLLLRRRGEARGDRPNSAQPEITRFKGLGEISPGEFKPGIHHRTPPRRRRPPGRGRVRVEKFQNRCENSPVAGVDVPSHRSMRILAIFTLSPLTLPAAVTATILAGGEFDLPEDRPSLRLDPESTTSAFAAVGALEMTAGGRTYLGSAVAIAPGWVLTAGHNVDFNDDGRPDSGLASTFHLPGFGGLAVTGFHTHPSFTGFGNPGIHHDLALLQLAAPLPGGLAFPGLASTADVGGVLTLVGFGRSGYGSYGYTTTASLVDRRIGFNTLETLEPSPGGDGLLFRYTFHPPDDPRSLGNDRETIIGPGDSGGPAFIDSAGGLLLVGINTFTEGFGGRFGDIGGGIALTANDLEWIQAIIAIPEPSMAGFIAVAVLVASLRRSRGRPGNPRSSTHSACGQPGRRHGQTVRKPV